MFRFFHKKSYDPMKVKKFYYYSPDKLKLVQIKNFIPKFIGTIALFSFSFSLLLLFLIRIIAYSSDSTIIANQDNIIKNEYKKELQNLKDRYIELAKEFNKLKKTTNDVRLAVNLNTLDLDEMNYGIGGTSFNDLSASLIDENDDKLSEIYEFVNSIEADLNFEKSNYEEIKIKFDENKKLFECLPAIRPVNSAIGDRYGMRFHPILQRRRMHYGLDFLCNTGEEVVAPGDGIITYTGKRGGYGKVIRINHGFGYETIYAHLSQYKVKKGQKVKRGELIAISGNSGSLSTGPHLHYEVRHKGISLNPQNFIFNDVKLFDKSYKRL